MARFIWLPTRLTATPRSTDLTIKRLPLEILRTLGIGGMGEVYAADDTKLKRQVALKILPQALASDPERRDRFEREAQAVASLNHPGIVTIHSVELSGDVPFLTMGLVDGKPLTESISRGGIASGKLLPIAISLADAIAI
jgi:serine/threonine protein kinase